MTSPMFMAAVTGNIDRDGGPGDPSIMAVSRGSGAPLNPRGRAVAPGPRIARGNLARRRRAADLPPHGGDVAHRQPADVHRRDRARRRDRRPDEASPRRARERPRLPHRRGGLPPPDERVSLGPASGYTGGRGRAISSVG